MTKEVYLDSIPESYKIKEVGRGANGVCYRTEAGKLFKHYFSQMDESFYLPLKDICDYSHSENLPQIIEMIFVQGNFDGYLRDYVDGTTIKELDLNTKVKPFIPAIKTFGMNMRDDIRTGIQYRDMHSENVIYTPDGQIKVIDYDLFYRTYDDMFFRDDLMYAFRVELSPTMLSLLMGSTETGIPYIDALRTKCTSRYENPIRPDQAYEETINYLERELQTNIETFNEVREGISLLRKK